MSKQRKGNKNDTVQNCINATTSFVIESRNAKQNLWKAISMKLFSFFKLKSFKWFDKKSFKQNVPVSPVFLYLGLSCTIDFDLNKTSIY